MQPKQGLVHEFRFQSVRKAFQTRGMDPSGSTPADFQRLVAQDARRWAQLIRMQKMFTD